VSSPVDNLSLPLSFSGVSFSESRVTGAMRDDPRGPKLMVPARQDKKLVEKHT